MGSGRGKECGSLDKMHEIRHTSLILESKLIVTNFVIFFKFSLNVKKILVIFLQNLKSFVPIVFT